MKVVRAIPASVERLSVTFSDGLAGSVRWSEVLAGTGLIGAKVRLDTVRPSAEGGIEFDTLVKQEGKPQQPDEVRSVAADVVYKILVGQDNWRKAFEVQGQYGPVTLAFAFIGKAKDSQATPPDESRDLTLREVQHWYTNRGWPRAGTLTSVDWRGRPKAYWQMV